MLSIIIKGDEFFDEEAEKFVTVGDVELRFEHSLVSVSKWESFWEKPFITQTEKTTEETLWYVKAMCLNSEIPEGILQILSEDDLRQIDQYINAKMTATTFNEGANINPPKETITAELIYYWMVALNIPFECQDWHLNRLITLIRVCNIKNQGEKKLTPAEMAARLAQRRALNEARRAELKSTG